MIPNRLHHLCGLPLPCLLSVPDTKSVSPRPILCFLHGYDEGAPVEIREGLTRHGPLKTTSHLMARDEFIVIAAQMPKRGDLWYKFSDALRQIVELIQKGEDGDPKRTYLTGFSYGGNGVFDLGAALPHVWAALWAVDPTRVPKNELKQPLWLSSGEISRLKESLFVQKLKLKSADTKYTEYDRIIVDYNQDHVGTATFAYNDIRCYNWLLSKSL
ncbi:hypothetical protein QA601_00240 [Chitinispirillales bacterium ANBcel5]|uniref:hypothetical protein n=1 Tax=Cellulosispirillum alkaliphilum TaxID=3039283 RepID=UPI002A56314D|nr:hypothetical protein [Chitinispirillales bacterium ANBcel5]